MKPNYLPIPMFLLATLVAGCLPASRTSLSTSAGTAEARNAIDRSRSVPTLGHDRQKVLAEAERWLGVPYRFGGNSPSGVDCSAFVCNVFQTIDKVLPRTSADQAKSGAGISLNESLPGDLVFFETMGDGVSHVGILIGGDQFVHASTSAGVTVSSLNEPYYHEHMLFIRRVLQ